MNPFSPILHDLRVRHNLRQADLAEVMGYEQSYISALELGEKGPPTDEFVHRLIATLSLSPEEQASVWAAAEASQRKFVIDPESPIDLYWFLNELRRKVKQLTPIQIKIMREVMGLQDSLQVQWSSSPHRIRRRKNGG